jgi:hypothetical protein
LPADTADLIEHITSALQERAIRDQIFTRDAFDLVTASSVLFLLGQRPTKDRRSLQTCLILNKRSSQVRQSGDLCCPGGRVVPRLDNYLAKFFTLPICSLGRWKFWPQWKRTRSRDANLLALFWATALRESAEEMRLNPLAVRFLGPLAAATTCHVSKGHLSVGCVEFTAETIFSKLGSRTGCSYSAGRIALFR